MKRAIFTLFIILITTVFSEGQEKSLKEISKIDVTQFENLKSDEISVFGLHLGMSPDEVHYVLMRNKNIDYQVDKMHGTTDVRIYVYDKDEYGKNKNTILYLIWKNRKPVLTSITFFEDFSPYLIGYSSALMTLEALNTDSEKTGTFLGKPDRSEITLNIPSIQMKHTSYFYDSKGFEITVKKSSEKTTVVFALNLIE